ncbi:MAG: hypothetical protein ACOC1P_02085 [Minisyncoccales bacterium]
MVKPNQKHEILPGLTGRTVREIKKKIIECDSLGITRVSLFLEFFSEKKKKRVIELLLDSKIKEIPFIHLKNDMSSEELTFFEKTFKTKYFNLHLNSFNYLEKWKGHYNKLLLELGYTKKHKDPYLFKKDFKKIKGFCIDLSHFKAAKERGRVEYSFVMQYKNSPEKFLANHLNGYSEFWKKDLHKPKTKKQLDYLKDLPNFIFGKYIALEMFNPIKEQLEFKEYVEELLKDKIDLK